MPGYKIQEKIANGEMVDLPIAATYDDAGNKIQEYYAKKTNIIVYFDECGRPCWRYDEVINNNKGD